MAPPILFCGDAHPAYSSYIIDKIEVFFSLDELVRQIYIVTYEVTLIIIK